jgi:hypothetical protein
MPRPAEVWLEVTPVTPETGIDHPAYLFYDANFEPKTPVPALLWTATDWPADAPQARVRFWCKSRVTPPVLTTTVADAAAIPAPGSFPIPGVSAVSCQVRVRTAETVQLGVVERHGPDSSGIDSLKVALESEVIPREVHHRFDATNHVVTHTFVFDKQDGAAVANARLTFTPTDAVRKGSWQLEQPVVIDISGTGDVIRPAAPVGVSQ